MARIIKESGLPKGALKLEVTEGDIMRDTAHAAEVLQSLKDVGASLALDDFGTGFSSLSYLARLPFDTLKIDRYFVLTMNKDEGSAKIVKSVVNLGRDLSLEVVAEGVENGELAALLLEAQCHYGQGFGYAPGAPGPGGGGLSGREPGGRHGAAEAAVGLIQASGARPRRSDDARRASA